MCFNKLNINQMEKLYKILKNMRCVVALEVSSTENLPSQHVKITISKERCQEGNIEYIFNILKDESNITWTLNLIP